MQTLHRRIEILKAHENPGKCILKNGDRILVIHQHEYIQGPAFVTERKQAALGVCESYLAQGIPSIIVESGDYFRVWHSRSHILELRSDISAHASRSNPAFKRWIGIGFPALLLTALASILVMRFGSDSPPQPVNPTHSSSQSRVHPHEPLDSNLWNQPLRLRRYS